MVKTKPNADFQMSRFKPEEFLPCADFDENEYFETKPKVLASVETKPQLSKTNTRERNSDDFTRRRTDEGTNYNDRDFRDNIRSRNPTFKRDEPQMRFDQRPSSRVSENSELALHTYLQRQGRSEYINLASQIGYDGKNIAFVFYENQIRRLMNESPYDERRLEVLRASCTGQPREMVNLFCVPMKNLSTSQRIEKALDRLRQRYGVSGGLTSEPNIIAIRNGPKVSFDLNSMKMFNEDLNTLEVFAFAHDAAEKLSGQLLLDTANRLPNILKRHYLDYLDKKGLNLSSPGLDSLRDFVVHEIKMMTSDYAQTFFKNENKDAQSSSRTKGYRVRQVTVGSESADQNKGTLTTPSGQWNKDKAKIVGEKSSNSNRTRDNFLPTCFVCNQPEMKHYLVDCSKFKSYSPEINRKTVIDAKRCMN